MWARVVEIMLGFWLMASPFILRFAETKTSNLLNDLLCGLIAMTLSFLSFWDKTGWAHFLTIAVALWLIGFGYIAGHPAPPPAQNQILVGILLGMFAVIPNKANEIPESWRKYYAAENNGKRIV